MRLIVRTEHALQMYHSRTSAASGIRKEHLELLIHENVAEVAHSAAVQDASPNTEPCEVLREAHRLIEL